MSYAQYWGVGQRDDCPLRLTQAGICQALILDWCPLLPVSLGSSFMGWPHHLLELDNGNPPYLTLRSIAGLGDRQWKGVLSWMLGISGTRKVIAEEGYTWIAPVSAFYPNRIQITATPQWHPFFPASTLEISGDPMNPSRLMPDYICARELDDNSVDFALVESKGTPRALNSLQTCPQDWSNQARKGVVKVGGMRVNIPRHLVIATRSNPNAQRQRYRRLQIRAWNSQKPEFRNGMEILVPLVSAHYYGLVRNLGLVANLKAMESSIRGRTTKKYLDDFPDLSRQADQELQKYDWYPSSHNDAYFTTRFDFGTIQITLSNVAISIIRALRSDAGFDDLVGRLIEESIGLSDWYSSINKGYKDKQSVAIDRSGFLVKIEEY